MESLKEDKELLLNLVPLFTAYKINTLSVLIERKVAFKPNACNLGRRWTQHPPKPYLKFLLSHESF